MSRTLSNYVENVPETLSNYVENQRPQLMDDTMDIIGRIAQKYLLKYVSTDR